MISGKCSHKRELAKINLNLITLETRKCVLQGPINVEGISCNYCAIPKENIHPVADIKQTSFSKILFLLTVPHIQFY